MRGLSLTDIPLLILAIVAFAISSGCRKPAEPPPAVARSESFKLANDSWFADNTEKSGLQFLHDTGPAGRYRMPEIMGSGCALFDYDNDGRLDIYLVQNGGPDGPKNQLFRQEPDGTFKDVSAGSGLDVAGWGMGVAVADVNNDGYPDVLVTEYGRLRLFLNNGNGTFRDVTEEAGLVEVASDAGREGSDAVTRRQEETPTFPASDEEGDAERESADAVTRRQKETPTFSTSPRLRFPASASPAPVPWYTSAAFFDYDRDGWLDLVVTQYVVYDPQRACTDSSGRPDFCGPSLFPGAVTKLYRNLGPSAGESVTEYRSDGVTAGAPNGKALRHSVTPSPRHASAAIPRFQDVTEPSGLSAEPGPGLGVVCLDFDGDGWPDIFVANDGKPNRLWINRHDGTFVDQAVQRGLAFNALGQMQGNMGIAVGDINGDGRFDLFVTHLTEEADALYVQHPIGMFSDQFSALGLAESQVRATGFGTVLADFENSGRPALAVANGRVVRTSGMTTSVSLPAFWQPYAERNFLFANDGHGKFRDVSDANPDFCARPNVGRSLAHGDIDNDGGIDLLLTTAGGEARIFHNAARDRGHWVLIRAIDPKLGSRDAIGAEVTIVAGGREQVGCVNSAGSYLCASDPRVHFGLGNAQRLDLIRVRWPDGIEELFPPTRADQFITLQRGNGKTQ